MNVSRTMVLAISGMVVLLVLGLGAIVVPNYGEAAEMRREVQDLRTKVSRLRDDAELVEQLADRVDEVRERLGRELKTVPPDPAIADLMRKLSLPVDGATVFDQNLAAGAVNPALPDDASPSAASVMALPLTVEMEASFDSVFALLRAVEAMPRLVRVRFVRLSCDRQLSAPQRPRLVASVGLEAIYEPPASELAMEAAAR